MSESKKNLFLFFLVICLVFLGVKYFIAQRELSAIKTETDTQNINQKTLAFTKLFIEKVLKAEQEVDFETRLGLENGVRNLNDEKILAQWQKFTDSKTEIEAQREVKQLLQDLVDNIVVK